MGGGGGGGVCCVHLSLCMLNVCMCISVCVWIIMHVYFISLCVFQDISGQCGESR